MAWLALSNCADLNIQSVQLRCSPGPIELHPSPGNPNFVVPPDATRSITQGVPELSSLGLDATLKHYCHYWLRHKVWKRWKKMEKDETSMSCIYCVQSQSSGHETSLGSKFEAFFQHELLEQVTARKICCEKPMRKCLTAWIPWRQKHMT